MQASRRVAAVLVVGAAVISSVMAQDLASGDKRVGTVASSSPAGGASTFDESTAASSDAEGLALAKKAQEYAGGAARLAAITPAGMRAEISLSLTDEYPLAHAIVVITAVPL